MPIVEYDSQQSYREADAINQSSLKVFADSPQLYYETYVTKQAPETSPSKSMIFGTAVENFLRTGGMHNYVRLPESIKVRRGKAWEEYRDSLPPGTQVLTNTEWDEIGLDNMQRVLRNVHRHPIAKRILDNAQWHRRIGWESANGSQCKAEIDMTVNLRSGRILCDLKTAADSSPEGFTRQVINLGYDVQAAWYSWGDSIVTQQDSEFVFLVVRNTFPFDVEVHAMSEDFMRRGLVVANSLLERLVAARESGIYESPTWGNVNVISPPAWALNPII